MKQGKEANRRAVLKGSCKTDLESWPELGASCRQNTNLYNTYEFVV